MADRGACAAADDAGDRRFLGRHPADPHGRCRPPSPRPERSWLRRGPERRDRVSLGRRRYDRMPALAAELVAPPGGSDRPRRPVCGAPARPRPDDPDRVRVVSDPVGWASLPALSIPVVTSPEWIFQRRVLAAKGSSCSTSSSQAWPDRPLLSILTTAPIGSSLRRAIQTAARLVQRTTSIAPVPPPTSSGLCLALSARNRHCLFFDRTFSLQYDAI